MKKLPLIALLAAALVAGCSDGGQSGPPKATGSFDPAKPVTLTWWTGQIEDGEKLLEGLAAEFHAKHPNVTITTSSGAPSTDKLLEKLSAGFAAGDYPDISYAFGAWATKLAASGKALDITDKVRQPDVKWDDIPQAAQKTVTIKGKVIGFPALIDDIGILYNKKLFDQAKVAYPTNDWTWEQFADAAKKLTDPAKKQYGTAWPVDGGEGTVYPFWPLLWQHGGDIVDAQATKATFDSDAAVQATTLLRRMAVQDKSVYLDQTATKIQPLFNSGNIAMFLTGPWSSNPSKKAGIDIGVSFLPGVNGDHQTIAGPDFWALLDHQDPARAHWAYEFVKWVTEPEQDSRFSAIAGSLPLRVSEGETAAFKQRLKDDPTLQVFFDNLKNAKNLRPSIGSYTEVSQEAANGLIKVLVQGADPKQALTEAAQKATSALDE
ncbi:ABC transporter substrate-binding protein [Nonomuraea sp. NPDC050536]|uniref:ABC transporter substrate-binding protein n=1 Tax=Nonomuraea sp. NPDC050536 TaxID=3364366 RepID=UPI0037C6A631